MALVAAGVLPSHAQARHPLDELSAAKYWKVFEALKASGRVNAETRYSGITLREPPKAEVLKWKRGEPFRREALVVVKQGAQAVETVVDVAKQAVVSWKEMKNAQPAITQEEPEMAGEKVKEDKDFQAALRKRGITDLETVTCGGAAPGYFGTAEEQGRRLLRIQCSDRRGVFNDWPRLIEGLMVVWDANEKKILRIIDTGPVPMPQAPTDYDAESVGQLREVPTPIVVEQPLGPSFRLDGHEVSWQKWSFHFRVDSRVGLVVSQVRYADGGKDRSVLYQGSLSEIFVPYMDPSEGWYHWTFIDAGEFSVRGGLAKSMERGSDCPENAVYFDTVYADQRALPQRWPRVACLFERSSGDLAWRHRAGPDQIESRRSRDLVLRMIVTLGNYDYLVDWIFRQNGSITVSAGTTGIDMMKGVRSRTVADDQDGRDGAYGRFIAANTVAPNHDHFFSFRLDLDVDGTANSFQRDRLEQQRLPAEHPRKSLWVVRPEVAKSEQAAKLHMKMEQPELWRVINPGVKGALGYPVSYQLQPGHNAMTLLTADDYPRRRAGFADYHIWVTPQRDDERNAAGDYPTASTGGDGLPAWTAANRPIENTDIVVWYTMGFHHVPRAEDYPVTPLARHEFELRPFDFFERNPALDLPKGK